MYEGLVSVNLYKCKDGGYYLDKDQFPEISNGTFLSVEINKEGISKTYPIFNQEAMMYGNYSVYIKHHGCAACSLTAILASRIPEFANYMPQDIVSIIEREVFGNPIWHSNYTKESRKQMPVSMKGISMILHHYNIQTQYISDVRSRHIPKVIISHLKEGNPIIIETSRVRYTNGIPVSIRDRKYAGSYHTMIILGIEADNSTVWVTDSATRQWSGKAQRLKRVPLSDIMRYMFSCTMPRNHAPYFVDRNHTGGFILVGDLQEEPVDAPPITADNNEYSEQNKGNK